MINHAIYNRPLDSVVPENFKKILFGMGCFWGVERCFWQLEGVYLTAAGYAGGTTDDPKYHDVCMGNTGHAEVVEVIYDPNVIATRELIEVFWEKHDPTQGMRQGNDLGTQYRSMVVSYSDEQHQIATETKEIFQQRLIDNGFSAISTEILDGATFYLAEEDHQQYLHKNPQGYCGLAGTGICF